MRFASRLPAAGGKLCRNERPNLEGVTGKRRMAFVAQAHPFVSARPRARWAKIFLIGTTVFNFFLLTLEATKGGLEASKGVELHEALIGFVTLFYVSAFFLSAVTFLSWLHRAVKNLSALGARKLRFTPGWAVGWFFVPFMDLIRPYEAVTELWHASDPAIPSYEPASRPTPAPVRWWWGLFVLWIVTSRLGDQLSHATSSGVFEGQAAHLLMIVSYVLEIPAAILAIRLIRAINQNQERKHSASSIGAPV